MTRLKKSMWLYWLLGIAGLIAYAIYSRSDLVFSIVIVLAASLVNMGIAFATYRSCEWIYQKYSDTTLKIALIFLPPCIVVAIMTFIGIVFRNARWVEDIFKDTLLLALIAIVSSTTAYFAYLRDKSLNHS